MARCCRNPRSLARGPAEPEPDTACFPRRNLGDHQHGARRYGRAPRGERVIASVPRGHWKTSTFVAGLRDGAITAPLVIDGAMNGETFRTYIEQFLAPTLAHGDIVIMDNLAGHKVASVREAIEARGASLIYLHPTRPISTQSNRPSPSSRRCCARPPRAPSRPFGSSSEKLSLHSPPANAKTISHTQAIDGQLERALGTALLAQQNRLYLQH